MSGESKYKVLLVNDAGGMENLLYEVKNVLQRAGMDVVEAPLTQTDENHYADEVKKILSDVRCSVQILGNAYGKTLPANPQLSFARVQYNLCKEKLIGSEGKFKMFLWYPPQALSSSKEAAQEDFINEIRNGIIQSMVFTNSSSSIQLVDDIRHIMEEKETAKFEIKDSEIFLVFNQLDETDASGVVDMLSDIVDVEKLTIVQDSETDYSELCKQQIPKTKLAVVYFKESADWALPFAQQVWKKVGGASSHTPILLIGDEDPDSNVGKKFNAPKVISLIVAGELIPLEIKVQYDKIVEAIKG